MQKIFLVFDNRDAQYVEQFETYFAPAIRSEAMKIWHHRKIRHGEIKPQIAAQLAKSDAIWFMLSNNLLASDYFYNIWKTKQNNHISVPIILKHCTWQLSPLGDLLALPRDEQPLVQRNQLDSSLTMEVVTHLIQEARSWKPSIEPPPDILITDSTDASEDNPTSPEPSQTSASEDKIDRVKNIRQLIIKGRWQEGLNALKKITPSYLQSDIFLLSSRYHRLATESRQGKIYGQDYNIELNRINSSVFSFIDELLREDDF